MIEFSRLLDLAPFLMLKSLTFYTLGISFSFSVATFILIQGNSPSSAPAKWQLSFGAFATSKLSIYSYIAFLTLICLTVFLVQLKEVVSRNSLCLIVKSLAVGSTKMKVSLIGANPSSSDVIFRSICFGPVRCHLVVTLLP